jgi:hypothetical protein
MPVVEEAEHRRGGAGGAGRGVGEEGGAFARAVELPELVALRGIVGGENEAVGEKLAKDWVRLSE